MKQLLVIAAVALGLFSCGDPAPPPSGAGPLVVYGHGGGIAFEPRRLVVGRDGAAVLTTRAGQERSERRFTLDEAQLDALESELAAAAGDTAPDEPSGCYDCFTYSIEADGIDVELDQVSIDSVSGDLQRLARTLERLSAP